MALNPRSVETVEKFFNEHFSGHSIGYTGRNKYGADEVFINGVTTLQTPELQKIAECSNAIGNTVSIIPQTKECVMICFW